MVYSKRSCVSSDCAGHLVQDVPEFPLVVTDKIQEYTRTKQAVSFLHRLRVWNDINKVGAMLLMLDCIFFFLEFV